MALALKVQFFESNSKRPKLELEPVWWDIDLLLDQYPFDFIGDWTFRDYEIILNGEEFIDMHLDMLKFTKEGVFQLEAWQEIIIQRRKALEEAIENIGQYPRIRVHIFEYG
ncbi:MAG: hypothetical protein MRZ79_01955 [Bacteroidia bacterium]|nr:hypothetical protein [Bacteroidia bacterium]